MMRINIEFASWSLDRPLGEARSIIKPHEIAKLKDENAIERILLQINPKPP
jgi:hypothetical protein